MKRVVMMVVVAGAVASASLGCREKETRGSATTAAVAPVAARDADLVTLAKPTSRPGEEVVVKFSRALVPPPGQQYWITITTRTEPEGAWGAWQYVAPGATSHTLPGPIEAGDYEVRLHDLYPQFSDRILSRRPLSVR